MVGMVIKLVPRPNNHINRLLESIHQEGRLQISVYYALQYHAIILRIDKMKCSLV